MKRRVFVGAIVLIAICGAIICIAKTFFFFTPDSVTQTTDSISKESVKKEYSEYGFAIDVPKNWEADDLGDMVEGIRLFNKDQATDRGLGEYIDIAYMWPAHIVRNPDGTWVEIDSNGKYLVSTLEQYASELLDAEEIVFAGEKAFRGRYEGQPWETVLVFHNEVPYTISFTSNGTPAIEEILHSFKFLN